MTNDIREGFGFALSETTQLWRQELDRRLHPMGLSQATWRALYHLERRGDGLTQRALADSIGIEEPSLVRLIDCLESGGLVERRPSAVDRRCKTLHLTVKARRVVDEIHATAAAVRANLLAGLSDDEIAQATATLRHIAANLMRDRAVATIG